jgi:hypothetical protein
MIDNTCLRAHALPHRPHAWAHMSQEGATWSHVSPVGPIVTIMSHLQFEPGEMHTCPMSPHQQQRCRSAAFFPRTNSLVLHLSPTEKYAPVISPQSSSLGECVNPGWHVSPQEILIWFSGSRALRTLHPQNRLSCSTNFG